MHILTVDVGTGTQDILLFDTSKTVENSLKMIMPSPTVIVAEEMRRAAKRSQDVLLYGVTMGGGPSAWAAEAHIRQGLRVYATPAAARSFNDDLDEVAKTGVIVVSEEEADTLQRVHRIECRDFDQRRIMSALDQFGVGPAIDAIAVAVFDHGAAPPGVSDRTFRFDYLREVVNDGDLTSFAHPRESIPRIMTRMHAIAATSIDHVPLLVMDTGPSAILGALEDREVCKHQSVLVANVGNFHTLAFHIVDGRVKGMFEHHTGLLDESKLEAYLRQLANGSISNDAVFSDCGHGAMVLPGNRPVPTLLAVTGPRRGLLRDSTMRPYFAVPHGDMMVAGCFGLLRGMAARLPQFSAAIAEQLG